MKLKYPYLPIDMEPIDSIEKYLEAQNRFHEAHYQWSQLNDQLLEVPLDKDVPQLIQAVERLRILKNQIKYEVAKRTPIVMVSVCPYCRQELWAKIGIYSLTSNFWYLQDSGGHSGATKETVCKHLFCMDGALNLHGLQPTEAHAPVEAVSNQVIRMAAGVPFVKPRVLNLPTMLAVVHAFPVAEKYTAYPIVYFAQEKPPQESFCIGWARSQYVDFHHKSNRQLKSKDHPKVVMIAERSDIQDYDLQKWVDMGKLSWVDPVTESHLAADEKFPYADVVGKRHPYLIREGKVTDLPDPVESKPKIRLEW